MEPFVEQYKPSVFNFNKYPLYVDYLTEYLRCKDFKSLGASIRYMFTHKLPSEDYRASSKMGSFYIRKGTTDFQFINEAYERKVKQYIRKNLDKFDVFIDAGACIGEYCIWLAKEGKRCIAIEPVNFEAVRKNITLNNVGNRVKIFTCGLGAEKERVFFNIPVGLPSSSHLERTGAFEPNVDIEPMDAIVSQFDIAPSDRVLMKMDVEGMEPELIEGARNFIATQKDLTLIYEHFETDNYRNDKALSAIASFSFADIDKVNRVAIKTA